MQNIVLFIQSSHIDAKGCHVCWMYTHWQKCQYMMPWDVNGLARQTYNLLVMNNMIFLFAFSSKSKLSNYMPSICKTFS